MKKTFICLCLSLVIVLTSCTNPFYVIRLDGVFESEDPKISVILEDSLEIFQGTIEKSDGTIMCIELRANRKRFAIYKKNENGEPEELLCYGDYKQKKNALILIPEEGDKIVLKKVSEVPEEYDNKTEDGSLIDKNQ